MNRFSHKEQHISQGDLAKGYKSLESLAITLDRMEGYGETRLNHGTLWAKRGRFMEGCGAWLAFSMEQMGLPSMEGYGPRAASMEENGLIAGHPWKDLGWPV